MTKSSKFRLINQVEKEIIFKSLADLSPRILQYLIKTKEKLCISLNESKSEIVFPIIYLIPNQIQKILENFDLKDEIISAGLNLGFIKKGNFYLSLEGAEFLYKQGILSDVRRLFVNKKGEKSILYGNNILKNMVDKTLSNIQNDDFLLIFNQLNEILAIAQSKIDRKNLQYLGAKDIIALNLNDKGYYLRKKQ
jgi:ribosome biogenesis protein Nip4